MSTIITGPRGSKFSVPEYAALLLLAGTTTTTFEDARAAGVDARNIRRLFDKLTDRDFATALQEDGLSTSWTIKANGVQAVGADEPGSVGDLLSRAAPHVPGRIRERLTEMAGSTIDDVRVGLGELAVDPSLAEAQRDALSAILAPPAPAPKEPRKGRQGVKVPKEVAAEAAAVEGAAAQVPAKARRPRKVKVESAPPPSRPISTTVDTTARAVKPKTAPSDVQRKILAYLDASPGGAAVAEIVAAVLAARPDVKEASVRAQLNDLRFHKWVAHPDTKGPFTITDRGREGMSAQVTPRSSGGPKRSGTIVLKWGGDVVGRLGAAAEALYGRVGKGTADHLILTAVTEYILSCDPREGFDDDDRQALVDLLVGLSNPPAAAQV